MPEQPRLTAKHERALTDIAAGLFVEERVVGELIVFGLAVLDADRVPMLNSLGCRRYLEIVEEQDA
jgi:hypothetical protein